MIEPTPWLRLLATSASVGVAPARFWRLSVKEWRALVATEHNGLTRSAFEALLQRFPDRAR